MVLIIIREQVIATIRYMVLKQMTGDCWVLDVLTEYFVYGNSPSEIAYRYAERKLKVRSYISRIKEKIRTSDAKLIVKYAVPIIKRRIRCGEMFNWRNGVYECVICGAVVKDRLAHSMKHNDVIMEKTKKIYDEVMKYVETEKE